MSGGVDSSVAACLLHEQGYDVTGLFMRTGVEPPEEDTCAPVKPNRHRGCCSAADASDARQVAGKLNIPFFALNFKDEFDRIIDYFAAEYQRGRTPNPCVMCNEHLKFGRLTEYGQAVDADFIATGHYARIEQRDGEHRLCRGIDPAKDQSYVLFGMGRAQLSRVLFPIGGMVKDEVRDHARRFGLTIHDKPDSVDICFVPDRDYAKIVKQRKPEAFEQGAIVDATGKEVGRHEGVANFTIGQRRGVGVAMGLPIYVTQLDANTNTVTIGSKEDLSRDSLEASRVQWLIEPPRDTLRADVKIRYAHPQAPATIKVLESNRVHVTFDDAQTAITPGQAAVFYHDDVVLGGGWID